MNIYDSLKKLLTLEKLWVMILYGIIGILLILFPVAFTKAIPYMLGLVLLLRSVISVVSILMNGRESGIKVGWILIDAVLGSAILWHRADAIGVIGALWAMMSLYDVAEEISESYESRSYSVVRLIFSGITIVLAVMLMFNPFEHFVVHVRILGLEILSSIFARRREARRKAIKEHLEK